jgi:DNA-binding NarL/FixJ family response regulator
VRANPQTARLPILMISGHSNYAMDARAKSAGADHFLNKPFTLTQLRSTVTALASKYRPLTAAEEAKIAASKPPAAAGAPAAPAAGGPPGPPPPTRVVGNPLHPEAIKVTSSAPLTDAKHTESH